jgi:hypothetical protein
MIEPPEYEDYDPEFWRFQWTHPEFDSGLRRKRFYD